MVSGLSLSNREGDVEGHGAALEEDGEAVALLDLLGDLVEVGHRAHLLAIDLTDDVAALEAGLLGGAAVLDARDDDALGGAEVQLARDLGGDRPHLDAQGRLAALRRTPAARLALLVGRLADLHLEALLALLAPDLDLGAGARRGEPHGTLEVRGSLHLLALELQQDVAGL